MRKLVSVLALLLFTAACDQQVEEVDSAACTDPTGSADTEMKAVEATRDQEVVVFTSGDATLPHAADDVVIMPPGEPMVGTVTLTPAGGETVSETMKGIHIYQRQGDGSWKMVEDVWNFDPAPAGDRAGL